MNKIKTGLIGYICFGKKGLEKMNKKKHQWRIPIIVSDKITPESTCVVISCKGGKKNGRTNIRTKAKY